jgi:hypothetical protein
MVNIATKPLERVARHTQKAMTHVAKQMAAGEGGDATDPKGWREMLVAIRAAELAVLLTTVTPAEQQGVADHINQLLGYAAVRFRLVALAS